MEFRFDANQDYQLQAIAAVTGLLEGQPRVEVDLSFGPGSGFAAVPNRLDLDEANLAGQPASRPAAECHQTGRPPRVHRRAV